MYIFLIYCFYHLTCLCNNFYGLSALVGFWSSIFIRRIIYIFFNVCIFNYAAFVASGKVRIPKTDLTTPVGWVSFLSFCGAFVLSMLLFGFFCGCRAFVIGLSSPIFPFLSIHLSVF